MSVTADKQSSALVRMWRYLNGPVPRVLSLDVVVGFLALGAMAGLGNLVSGYHLYVLTIVVIFTVVGASHTLLFGAAGQPSVAQAALLGAGAYTGALISTKAGLDLPAEIVAALVVGAVIGLVIGLPSLRIGDLYLAIATLALGAVAQQVFFEWTSVTGGGAGVGVQNVAILGTPLTNIQFFYACLGVAGVSLLMARNLLRGDVGRAWHGIRANPTAATALGVSVGGYKTMAFVVSGAMTSVAGVLYVHAVNYVSSEDFSVDLSILTLTIAIIGGQRYLWGAALGSAFVMGLPELLRQLGQYRMLVYGFVFILVMLYFPEGFAGGIRWVWSRFAVPVLARIAPPAFSRSSNPPAPDESVPQATLGVRSPTLTSPHIRDDSANANANANAGSLAVEELRVVYGGVMAVVDVSLQLESGEVLGLVGPNGAGKSSLLNAISGFAPIESGRIRVGGADLTRSPAAARAGHGVGRTFQNLSLYSGLTVLEHAMAGLHAERPYGVARQMLRLPGFVRGESWVIERAYETLRALDLMPYADQDVSDLPYGVQKRVDVARAIAIRPRLLLLDEPAAGLPPDEADELLDVVLVLSAEVAATVVMVEHNIDLVMRVAQRVVAMDAGRVIADGTPEQVRTAEDFVRSYIGV